MKKVIVIVGPTASGKTKTSVELAKALNTEIINGDSVQVYKELNIGSAKVTTNEMQGIKHHLLDFLEADASFSVAEYQKLVRDKIEEINDLGKIPIICGGTGFYIQAALGDYDFTSSERSKEFEEKYKNYSDSKLHKLLLEIDPLSAAKYPKENRNRVLRAIEIYETTSELPSLKNKGSNLLYDALIISLTMERDILYERINHRVDLMIEEGLVDEVKSLYKKNINSQAVKAIGYKEIYRYLNKEISLEKAIEEIKKNTRRFAKRQFTWFRNKMDVVWVDVDLDNFDNTVREVIKLSKDFINR